MQLEKKRQTVRHRDAIVMYALTYWPKDEICADCIDPGTKICISQHALVLQSIQHSRQPISHRHELLSALHTELRQTQQPPFTTGNQGRQ